jgi:hypothetical protein
MMILTGTLVDSVNAACDCGTAANTRAVKADFRKTLAFINCETGR